MSFLNSLQLSVFGLGMVFVVLIALSAVLSLESKIFSSFDKNKKDKPAVGVSDYSETEPIINTVNESAGELKLIDVDERTAAMIMAIVSDESSIPLSELRFKYIKALD